MVTHFKCVWLFFHSDGWVVRCFQFPNVKLNHWANSIGFWLSVTTRLTSMFRNHMWSLHTQSSYLSKAFHKSRACFLAPTLILRIFYYVCYVYFSCGVLFFQSLVPYRRWALRQFFNTSEHFGGFSAARASLLTELICPCNSSSLATCFEG